MVRTLFLISTAAVCLLTGFVAAGETFKLTTGQEVTGEMLTSSANEQGVQIKVGEGNYQRLEWGKFSQDDLRTLAQNPKLQPLLEPFIEVTQAEKLQRTEVKIQEPQRLKRPAGSSVLGGMLSSPLGLFLLALVYAATIYAGLEVARFRAQPPLLVAGLAAVPFIGFLSPIVFLAMPMRLKSSSAEEEVTDEGAAGAAKTPGTAAPAAAAGASTADEDLNPMHADGAQHPSSLHLAHEEKPAHKELPKPVIYQRGQFTFNRRFFETKFSNFFGVVKRDADKDMLLVIKSARGEYHADRISRIAANDVHVQVRHAHGATEEIMVPFIEIQELRLQHKDTIGK